MRVDQFNSSGRLLKEVRRSTDPTRNYPMTSLSVLSITTPLKRLLNWDCHRMRLRFSGIDCDASQSSALRSNVLVDVVIDNISSTSVGRRDYESLWPEQTTLESELLPGRK